MSTAQSTAVEGPTDLPPALGLLKERTLTSLEDAYEKFQQQQNGATSSEPQAAYLQHCERLQATLSRVCLAQLADARVRFCFYYPHERQAAAFLKAVQLNSGLLELNLKDNGFTSKAKLARVGRLLEDHGTIARLNLSHNPLAPGALAALHRSLLQGTALVCLRLSCCNLTDSDGALLAEFLMRDKHLESLDLSGNRLAGQSAAALADALRQNAYLVELDLAWNNLSCAHCVTLASGLAANTELRRLSCSSNGAEDRGLAALLEAAAAESSRLRVLELDSCRLTHLGLPALLRLLRSRPGQLHALKLNRNLFRERDLLQLLAVSAAEPECQLALLEMNSVTRTPAITAATPEGLRLTLRMEREVRVKLVDADLLG